MSEIHTPRKIWLAGALAAVIWLVALLWAWLPSSYVMITTNVPNYGDFPVHWVLDDRQVDVSEVVDLQFENEGREVLHLNHFHNRYPIAIPVDGALSMLEIQPDQRLSAMYIRSIEIKFPWAAAVVYAGEELFETATVSNIGVFKRSGKGMVVRQFGKGATLKLQLNARKEASSNVALVSIILIGAAIAWLLVWFVARVFSSKPKILLVACKLGILGAAAIWFLQDKLPFNQFVSAMLLPGAVAVTTGLLFRCSQIRPSEQLAPTAQRVTGYLLAALVIFLFTAHGNLYRWILNVSPVAPVKVASFEQLGELANNIEKNFSATVPYKDWLVYINSLVKTYVFKRSPNSKVILGDEGMFFEGYGERKVEKGSIQNFDNVTDYIGLSPFPEDHLERWRLVLEARQCWLNKQGIAYLFALAPTKGLVYPEFLPARVRALRQDPDLKTRYDELLQYIQDNSSLPIVDVRQHLLTAKQNNGPLLFYKTDFHWNFLGSFFAYQPIAEKLAKLFPNRDIEPMQLEAFDMEINENWYHPRFLNLIGFKPEFHATEHYLSLRPKSESQASSISVLPDIGISDVEFPYEEIQGLGGAKVSIKTVRNPEGELDSMLILGDSFIEKSVLYLASHAKTTYFQRAVFQFPHASIAALKPEVVVQEVLNMFILRDPPNNPQNVWDNYSSGDCTP